MKISYRLSKPDLGSIKSTIFDSFQKNKIYILMVGVLVVSLLASFYAGQFMAAAQRNPTAFILFGVACLAAGSSLVVFHTGRRVTSEREAEYKRYKSMIDHISDVIWVVDLDTMQMTFISPAVIKQRGYTQEEAARQSIEEALSPQALQILQNAMPQRIEAFTAGDPAAESAIYEFEQFCVDGSTIYIQTMTTMYFNAEGHLELIGVTRDMTNKRRLEKEKERYELMASNSQDVILFLRAEDGLILEANNMAEQLYGFSHSEFLEITIYDLLAFPNQGLDPDEMAEVFWDGLLYETVHHRKNGVVFPVEVHSKGFLYEGQRILVSSIRDITARKRTEQALFDSETRFRSLFSSMADGFSLNEVILDENGSPCDYRIMETNSAFEKMIGVPKERLVGKQVSELYADQPEKWQNLLKVFKQVVLTQQPIRIENTSKDNQQYYDIYMFTSLYGQVAVIYTDITIRKQAEEQLRKMSAAIQHSSVSVVITDTNGTMQYVNPKFTAVTGYSLDEAVGQNSRILRTWVTPHETFAELWQTILAGKTWQGEFCNVKKNGEYYWESSIISPILDENGNITHFVAVKEDITERRQLEEAVRSERDFAMLVMNTMGQGLTVTDRKGRYEYVNPAFTKLLQMTADELEGMYPSTMITRIQDREKPQEDPVSNQDRLYTYEALIKRSDGGMVPVLVTEVPRFKEGEFFGNTSVITDLTEQKQVEDHLRYMGSVDMLTGAYNRTFFANELAQIERSRDYPVSIIVADIDNLKPTNDTYGHLVGDQLIQRAARVLKSVVRSTDFIARIGGDEFALIMSRTDEKNAEQVVKRIRENIQSSNNSEEAVSLGMSLGLATSLSGNLVETLNEADARMYEEKRIHKLNQVR